VTEPALGIAGVVLLALAIVALFLRPRRSKGRMVDAGLATGAGLLGLAIGLVIADRVHRPVAILTAPTQPAAPATGYVESRLSLQFPIDDESPTGSGEANVADWYALRNSISCTPPADEKTGKPSDQMLKLLTDVSWSWLIVIAFDRPTQYSRIDVTFTGGQLPYYQIARQNPRYAIIHVQGHIPAGQMDIVTSE